MKTKIKFGHPKNFFKASKKEYRHTFIELSEMCQLQRRLEHLHELYSFIEILVHLKAYICISNSNSVVNLLMGIVLWHVGQSEYIMNPIAFWFIEAHVKYH